MKRPSTYMFISAALLIAPGLFYLYQAVLFGTSSGELKDSASFVLAYIGLIALVVAAVLRDVDK